jgi:CDP-glucose 4,6-dehydratase
VRSVLRKEPVVIRSDGASIRDYLYIEDGVSANVLLAERLAQNPVLRGEAFNFSYEQPITVLDLVERTLKLMGSSVKPVILNEVVNEIPRQFLSATKARKVLGWQPRHPLEEGLRKTIDWYKDFFGARS